MSLQSQISDIVQANQYNIAAFQLPGNHYNDLLRNCPIGDILTEPRIGPFYAGELLVCETEMLNQIDGFDWSEVVSEEYEYNGMRYRKTFYELNTDEINRTYRVTVTGQSATGQDRTLIHYYTHSAQREFYRLQAQNPRVPQAQNEPEDPQRLLANMPTQRTINPPIVHTRQHEGQANEGGEQQARQLLAQLQARQQAQVWANQLRGHPQQAEEDDQQQPNKRPRR